MSSDMRTDEARDRIIKYKLENLPEKRRPTEEKFYEKGWEVSNARLRQTTRNIKFWFETQKEICGSETLDGELSNEMTPLQ